MTFFRLAGGIAAALLSSTVLAVTLSPTAAGTAYHSELTSRSFDSTGQLVWVTETVDSATPRDPAGWIPLQIWPNSRSEPFGYWEDRAWVGFAIPDLTGQDVTAVALSAKNNYFAGGSLYVDQVASVFPAGGSITGSEAASIFTDVGGGTFGSGTLLANGESTLWLGGAMLSEVLAHAGGILYLGLSTRTIQIPLQLSDLKLHISTATVVPLPAALWLFGSALAGLFGVSRFRRAGACGQTAG